MNIIKNQHQLYRGYFRRFSKTGKDTDLFFYDKQKKKFDYKITSSKNITTEDFLYETKYTYMNQIENWFSSREDKWSKTHAKSITRSEMEFEDFAFLVEFSILSILRQKRAINNMGKILNTFLTGIDGQDLYKKSLNVFCDNICNSVFPSWNVSVFQMHSHEILISSDNPVIVIKDDYVIENWMIPLVDFDSLIVPIASDKLLVIYRKHLPLEVISNINLITVRMANRILFTEHKQVLTNTMSGFYRFPCHLTPLSFFPIQGKEFQVGEIKIPLSGFLFSLAGKETHYVSEDGEMQKFL